MENLEEVPRDVFFAAIGPLNVHPRVDIASLKERYHVSIWEIQGTRERVGKSISDSHGSGFREYFLTPQYAEKGRSTLKGG